MNFFANLDSSDLRGLPRRSLLIARQSAPLGDNEQGDWCKCKPCPVFQKPVEFWGIFRIACHKLPRLSFGHYSGLILHTRNFHPKNAQYS